MINRGIISEGVIVIIYLKIGGNNMLLALQILFGVLAAGTGIGLIVDIAKNRMDALKSANGKQWAAGFTVGIIANFLDTLGCGSYAPSTFMYKLFNQMDDIDIPGTLNIGDTFPVIFEAFIFTASVDCDPMFLWIMYICAAVGSFGFATIVTKWPRNKIRYALGFIMIPLALIMLMDMLILLSSEESDPTCRLRSIALFRSANVLKFNLTCALLPHLHPERYS